MKHISTIIDDLNMKYKAKDAVKFSICTKLITRGAPASSSHGYSLLPHANTGNYQPEDIVGISVNGKRYNRIPHDEAEIRLAASSQVRFVTDNRFHRNRSFNIGEREVADLLESLGYKCSECDERAIWSPSTTPEELEDEHPMDYFEAMHERLHDGYYDEYFCIEAEMDRRADKLYSKEVRNG